MNAILYARRDQPDDALVPRFIEQTQSSRHDAATFEMQLRHRCERLRLHALLDLAPLLIELAQLRGQPASLADIVSQEALDSHAHVIEPPGGVEPRSDRKAQVLCHDSGGHSIRLLEKGRDPCHTAPSADALQPL